MPSFVPLVAATASLEREVLLALSDPPRPVGPHAVEPRVLREGVGRYAGRALLFARLAGTTLACPARCAIRRAAIDPSAEVPGVTDVLELSPLPFGLEPVLRRMRGLPTFYVAPFDAALVDDAIVEAGGVLSATAGTSFVAAVFPDGLQLAPWSWMQIVGDALAGAGDSAAAGWTAQLAALYGNARRCRVLDHAGRPLASATDPAVSKTFNVRLRDASNDGLVAERSVTLGGDSDLETALAAAPGTPSSVVAPPGRYVEAQWLGAPPPSDAAAPVIAAYETREAAAPADEHAAVAALRLPAGPRMTLQVLDLSRWFPPVAPQTAIARYRAASQVTPLVDGIATFQRLAADLRNATDAGHGAYLAGWTFNRFALDPTISDDDIVDLVKAIRNAGADRTVRVSCTKLVNLKNPDLPRTRKLALLLLTLLTDAAFLDAVLEARAGKGNTDSRGQLAFVVAPLLAAALTEAAAAAGDFQWLIDALVESATGTIADLNGVAPGLAIFSSNPHRIADNPLADALAQPLFGLEADVDQFNVWHNKSQMVRRRAADGENGWVGYLGGIDVNRNRFDSPGHGVKSPYHDVHARVTGPVVRDVFTSFEERWDVDHPPPGSVTGGLAPPPVDGSVPGTRRPSRHVARVGRTYYGPRNPADAPLKFAPHGDAGIYATLRAAIAAARDVIYIEDQYFTPDDSFVDLLLAAREHCRRLLIVMPGVTDQPFGDNRRRLLLARLQGTSPSDGWDDRMLVGFPQRRPMLQANGAVAARGRCSLARACGASDGTIFVAPHARVLAAPFWLWIDGELMLARQADGPVQEGTLTATRLDVVRGSAPGSPRWGATPRAHAKGAPVTMSMVRGIYVHAKTMMIDDTFVSIGSANLNRRGFFSDGEINVFAIPEQLRAAPDNPARALRTALWAEHLGVPPAMGPALFEDPIAGFELFRRSARLGNRFTPLAATDPRSQITFTSTIEIAIAELVWTVLGNPPLLPGQVDDVFGRFWDIAIDATSRTDPDPRPGLV
jgi:phosphatidylserine/phosphatidylglycerophosphate/cardiolipin synthase-like enzyme